MFLNQEKNLAFAGASDSYPQSDRAPFLTLASRNSEYDDFNSFNSSYNSNQQRGNTRRPEQQRPQNNNGRPPQRRAPAPRRSSSMFIAIGAVAALVILMIIIISAIASSSKDIKLENNAYASYTDTNGLHHVVVNGTDVGTYENDITIVPAKDHSFAYIVEDSINGKIISYIDGKKIKDITQNAVGELLGLADYAPGVIYRSNNIVYVDTAADGDSVVTRNTNSGSFIISGDASTVVYNETDSNGRILLMMYTAEANIKLSETLQPHAIAIDGSLVYASATSAKDNLTKILYVVDDDGDSHAINQGYDDILELNVEGDEIIFSAPTNGSISSYIYRYNSSRPDKYEPQLIGRGEYTSAKIDGTVVCLETFKGAYLEGGYVDSTEAGEISKNSVLYIKKFGKDPVLVAESLGKFTPNGEYFYYVTNSVLYKKDLSKLDKDPVEVWQDTVEYEVTAKGGVYMLDSGGQLRFHKANEKNGRSDKVTFGIDAISMHEYSNRLYADTSTSLTVSVCEEGVVKNDDVKFDSENVPTLPLFLDPALKNSFVAVYDETTAKWTLYYTSNGKSFKTVTDDCTSIDGVPDRY